MLAVRSPPILEYLCRVRRKRIYVVSHGGMAVLQVPALELGNLALSD